MNIPIVSRGSVVLMMVGAAVTPLFMGGAHTLGASEKVRVQERPARAPSASVGSPEYSSAGSPGDRLNAYLETANELWNRTHDARAVRELLRVAQEDLAAAAQPTAGSPTPNAPNMPTASAGVRTTIAKTALTTTADTSPAARMAAPGVRIAAAAPGASLPSHPQVQSFTIRASTHGNEGERLQRQLAAWRAHFEILSAAGTNLASAAILSETAETEAREVP